MIFISYGIGGGIYLGGEFVPGQHQPAGELGLVLVHVGERRVPLEERASLKRLRSMLGLSPNQPNLFAVLDAILEPSPPEVEEWIADACKHFAWAIDTVRCLLDPTTVVIGGQMPKA